MLAAGFVWFIAWRAGLDAAPPRVPARAQDMLVRRPATGAAAAVAGRSGFRRLP